jgi:hypothetical protein
LARFGTPLADEAVMARYELARKAIIRGFLALLLGTAVAACDTREDPEGLPSPEETSLPGVTYSGGPTPTGDASGD